MTGANWYPDHLFITKNRSVHKLSLVGSKQVIHLCCQLIGARVSEPHKDNFAVNSVACSCAIFSQRSVTVMCMQMLHTAASYPGPHVVHVPRVGLGTRLLHTDSLTLTPQCNAFA